MTLLFDGRMAQSGDKATLYPRPASLAAARFLGLKNLFPARIVAPGAADCQLLGGRLTVTDAQPADRSAQQRAQEALGQAVNEQPSAFIWDAQPAPRR
jgi:ABC-type Fe3+/spermidine/putrescine transport system ATPase subunit